MSDTLMARRGRDYKSKITCCYRSVGILVLGFGWTVGLAAACAPPPPPADAQPVAADGIVDSFSIETVLDGMPRRVTPIGIRMPDTHRQGTSGPEAQQAVREQVEAFAREVLEGRVVRLEFDAQRADSEGRVLAYVWLHDGRLFNAELLNEGYAQVMIMPPNVRYASLLEACELNAREAGRGLWKR